MAERRMFTNKITESDSFLDMPMSSQCLYFHLCMNADDDGFVKNPKRISRMVGASDDDLKLLLVKGFAIAYDTGVLVIKHWRMHNLLRKDRYTETEYMDEKAMLYIKENGAYTLDPEQGKPLVATKWQPNGNQMAPQDSIGKDSIGNNKRECKRKAPTLDDVKAYIAEKGMTVNAQTFFDYYNVNEWKDVKNWKQKLITWQSHEKDKKNGFHNFEERPTETDTAIEEFTRMMEGE